MHYLTYVVGDDPEQTLTDWGIDEGEYEIGGRWGHLSERSPDELPTPAHILYGDARYISRDEVGEEAMKEQLKVLDVEDRITVVDLNV